MRQYSSFFETIHDTKRQPSADRSDTSFSILRCVAWNDPLLTFLTLPKFHTFAIVWDEDHDERVIGAAEKLYFSGVLPAISALYEHQGNLIVRLLNCIDWNTDPSIANEIIRRIAQNGSSYDDDHWNVGIDSQLSIDKKYGCSGDWPIPRKSIVAIENEFTLGQSPITRFQSAHKYWALEA